MRETGSYKINDVAKIKIQLYRIVNNHRHNMACYIQMQKLIYKEDPFKLINIW